MSRTFTPGPRATSSRSKASRMARTSSPTSRSTKIYPLIGIQPKRRNTLGNLTIARVTALFLKLVIFRHLCFWRLFDVTSMLDEWNDVLSLSRIPARVLACSALFSLIPAANANVLDTEVAVHGIVALRRRLSLGLQGQKSTRQDLTTPIRRSCSKPTEDTRMND